MYPPPSSPSNGGDLNSHSRIVFDAFSRFRFPPFGGGLRGRIFLPNFTFFNYLVVTKENILFIFNSKFSVSSPFIPLQRGRLNLESKFFVVGISNFLTQTNNSLFEMSIFKLKLLK